MNQLPRNHFSNSVRHRNRRRGFTLVELLMVMAILATLAAIAVPTYRDLLLKLKQDNVISELKDIEQEIARFEAEHGRLPTSLAEAGIDKKDPWGNPYQFILIKGQPLTGKDKVSPRKDRNLHPINSDYDLWSMGPDGKTQLPLTAKASHDDIIRAKDGGYFGNGKDF